MHHTLRNISGLIAATESRPEEPIFNQLKGLAGRNILQPVPNFYGKKGALLFPRKEVFRARMLLAALDNGFTSEKLARFDAQMRAESRSLDPTTGRHYTRSFDVAAVDLDSDKPMSWLFEVGRLRTGDELDFSGYWIADGIRRGAIPDWSQPRPGFEGITNFAFTQLCAPLHEAMKAGA